MQYTRKKMEHKIDLMIVGAQKAGTTSLNNYLNEHPYILGHPQTEFAYFTDDKMFKNNFEKEFTKHFTKGKYSDKVKIVAKNAGIYSSETAIKRLYEHNKKCKIIFILREPVARAFSSYSMEKSNGWLDRDFSELRAIIDNNQIDDVMYKLFIKLGLYAEHLEIIYKYFPKEQVKIIFFEDLKSNSDKIVKEIYKWIGVSNKFSPNTNKKYNITKKEKSKIFSKILINLRNNDNIIKKIFKIILPYSLFSKVGNYLIESNKSNKSERELITNEMKIYLQKYFKPFNEKLSKVSGLENRWKYNA